MALEDIPNEDFLLSSLSLIVIIITITVGLMITLKYFTYKRRELITVGLSIIFVTSVWWGGAIAFVLFITIDYSLPFILILFISFGFQTVSLMSWIYSFSILWFQNR